MAEDQPHRLGGEELLVVSAIRSKRRCDGFSTITEVGDVPDDQRLPCVATDTPGPALLWPCAMVPVIYLARRVVSIECAEAPPRRSQRLDLAA